MKSVNWNWEQCSYILSTWYTLLTLEFTLLTRTHFSNLTCLVWLTSDLNGTSFSGNFIWIVSCKNRFFDLCHCHTKRRLGWYEPNQSFFCTGMDFSPISKQLVMTTFDKDLKRFCFQFSSDLGRSWPQNIFLGCLGVLWTSLCRIHQKSHLRLWPVKVWSVLETQLKT